MTLPAPAKTFITAVTAIAWPSDNDDKDEKYDGRDSIQGLKRSSVHIDGWGATVTEGQMRGKEIDDFLITRRS